MLGKAYINMWPRTPLSVTSIYQVGSDFGSVLTGSLPIQQAITNNQSVLAVPVLAIVFPLILLILFPLIAVVACIVRSLRAGARKAYLAQVLEEDPDPRVAYLPIGVLSVAFLVCTVFGIWLLAASADLSVGAQNVHFAGTSTVHEASHSYGPRILNLPTALLQGVDGLAQGLVSPLSTLGSTIISLLQPVITQVTNLFNALQGLINQVDSTINTLESEMQGLGDGTTLLRSQLIALDTLVQNLSVITIAGQNFSIPLPNTTYAQLVPDLATLLPDLTIYNSTHLGLVLPANFTAVVLQELAQLNATISGAIANLSLPLLVHNHTDSFIVPIENFFANIQKYLPNGSSSDDPIATELEHLRDQYLVPYLGGNSSARGMFIQNLNFWSFDNLRKAIFAIGIGFFGLAWVPVLIAYVFSQPKWFSLSVLLLWISVPFFVITLFINNVPVFVAKDACEGVVQALPQHTSDLLDQVAAVQRTDTGTMVENWTHGALNGTLVVSIFIPFFQGILQEKNLFDGSIMGLAEFVNLTGPFLQQHGFNLSGLGLDFSGGLNGVIAQLPAVLSNQFGFNLSDPLALIPGASLNFTGLLTSQLGSFANYNLTAVLPWSTILSAAAPLLNFNTSNFNFNLTAINANLTAYKTEDPHTLIGVPITIVPDSFTALNTFIAGCCSADPGYFTPANFSSFNIANYPAGQQPNIQALHDNVVNAQNLEAGLPAMQTEVDRQINNIQAQLTLISGTINQLSTNASIASATLLGLKPVYDEIAGNVTALPAEMASMENQIQAAVTAAVQTVVSQLTSTFTSVVDAFFVTIDLHGLGDVSFLGKAFNQAALTGTCSNRRFARDVLTMGSAVILLVIAFSIYAQRRSQLRLERDNKRAPRQRDDEFRAGALASAPDVDDKKGLTSKVMNDLFEGGEPPSSPLPAPTASAADLF